MQVSNVTLRFDLTFIWERRQPPFCQTSLNFNFFQASKGCLDPDDSINYVFLLNSYLVLTLSSLPGALHRLLSQQVSSHSETVPSWSVSADSLVKTQPWPHSDDLRQYLIRNFAVSKFKLRVAHLSSSPVQSTSPFS